MVQLTLTRNWPKDEYIIGRLYVDGAFWCNTLERPRYYNGKENVSQKCCVPAGTYKVIMKQSGKFGRILPTLCSVPGRSGILIHRGNTAKDTSGCILPGENKVKGKVVNSTEWENKLVGLLRYEKDIRITIKWV